MGNLLRNQNLAE